MIDRRDPFPCEVDPTVWDAENYLDALAAIEGCATCPHMAACVMATARLDLVGIVAGRPADVATRDRLARRYAPAGRPRNQEENR